MVRLSLPQPRMRFLGKQYPCHPLPVGEPEPIGFGLAEIIFPKAHLTRLS